MRKLYSKQTAWKVERHSSLLKAHKSKCSRDE